MAQLGRADEAIAVTIEDLEGFDQLLFCVSVFHLTCHERQELGKINRAIAVRVHLVDHVLELSLRWVLSQRSHHCTQLLGCDGAIAILVKKRECLLELSNLLLSELVGHGSRKAPRVSAAKSRKDT